MARDLGAARKDPVGGMLADQLPGGFLAQRCPLTAREAGGEREVVVPIVSMVGGLASLINLIRR
jgi:hypothetical protein